MKEKTEYVKIADLPKSKRGQKEIPKDWVEMIQKIPSGNALVVSDLKYSTVQGRIRHLVANKTLDETYKVMQRKLNDKQIVYVAHTED
jgi:hypothetical protein